MGRIIAEPYVNYMTHAHLVDASDFWLKALLTEPLLNRPSEAIQATNRITVW